MTSAVRPGGETFRRPSRGPGNQAVRQIPGKTQIGIGDRNVAGEVVGVRVEPRIRRVQGRLVPSRAHEETTGFVLVAHAGFAPIMRPSLLEHGWAASHPGS